MGARELSPDLLSTLADRFRALAEPRRLLLLQQMLDGEATVSDLVTRTGLTQANVSKHLQLLHASGFVARRKDGLFVFYRLADRDVFRLCDLMCGRLEREVQAHHRLLAPVRPAPPGRA
jgi:ArsR family transcriptional regulator, arsenate/arsenite/antimonite-responsive transcriptional repressor